MNFVHLHVHTPWSFLDGADSIVDLVQTAVEYNMPALAMTDHNSVSAVVRFSRAAKEAGIKPIVGCEVDLAGCLGRNGRYHLTLLATGPAGYANLCTILTLAHTRQKRGQPLVQIENLAEHAAGLIALSGCRAGEIPALLLRRNTDAALAVARRFVDIFGRSNFFIEMQALHLPHTHALNAALSDLAQKVGVEIVATNNVHYARQDRFPLHDILTCVRTGTTLDDVHAQRSLNAENALYDAERMAELFREYPRALANTLEIASRCEEALAVGRRYYPKFTPPGGCTAAEYLREKAYVGAMRRYGALSAVVRERLDYELRVIEHLDVADYFLVVSDIVDYARQHHIRYCGRGSSANSVVAHALDISEVDPVERGLLFERFLSIERSNMPDIDVDFAADRRDEVIEYVFDKYGRDHVGMVCAFSTYQSRSMIRDFGKALGFSAEEIDALAKSMPRMHADHLPAATEAFPELRHSGIDFSRYTRLFELAAQAAGFPRHISTHLGGVVITDQPIAQVSPLQISAKGVPVVQFDKNDVEELGLLKLDLLSLRTLGAVETSLRSLRQNRQQLDYDRIPPDDAATFAMINRAETIGVFQLESSAQRALQQMITIRNQDDIVASVALIRPGPMQGNMVSPFIRRHEGEEEPTYADPRLEPILRSTYGVVLFQEQVLQIAVAIAGFTPGEADKLRKAMTDCRSAAEMERVLNNFSQRAVAQGCTPQAAEEIAVSLAAYAGYGFCQGHAEAFGKTSYRTAYLLQHYPAYYLAGIMSHQPMGFYPTRTLCVEARRRGIRILRPDINKSEEYFSVEDAGKAIRVSLRQVRKAQQAAVEIVEERNKNGPYRSFVDFCVRVRPAKDVLENLILAGAFDAFDPNRRRLLWNMDAALAARRAEDSLFPGAINSTGGAQITDFSMMEKVRNELRVLGFTISAHPMQMLRLRLDERGVATTTSIAYMRPGSRIHVAGLVVRPQRPPIRSGHTVVFFTLEDEYGVVEVTVFEKTYQRDGRAIFTQPAVEVTGRLDKRGKGISLIAERIRPLDLPTEY